MMTAAISSSASVREWKPPVSTSMTTGRKPRKRFDASSVAAMWRSARDAGEAPAQGFARAQRHDAVRAEGIVRRHRPGLPPQLHAGLVQWQAIEARAEFAGKGLEPGQCAGLLEYLRIEFQGRMRGIDAGAAT